MAYTIDMDSGQTTQTITERQEAKKSKSDGKSKGKGNSKKGY